MSFHELHWDLDLVFNSFTKFILFSAFKYVSELFYFKIHYDLLFDLHGFYMFFNTIFIFHQLLLVKFKPCCSPLPMRSLSHSLFQNSVFTQLTINYLSLVLMGV